MENDRKGKYIFPCILSWAHDITYFVDRQTCDGMPASDVKSINENAYALSEKGHIQKVDLTTDPQSIYVRSICLPEMRKNRIYKVTIVLDNDSNDILAAGCECLAGKAPTASCKHVDALCYTLDRFCKKKGRYQASLPVLTNCNLGTNPDLEK